MAEKLAQLRSENKSNEPVLDDLRSFLRIPGNFEEDSFESRQVGRQHKKVAALPLEVFRNAVQNHEASAAKSRSKLRVVRDLKLREDAQAHRHEAVRARRDREQWDAVVTATVQDFEEQRHQRRRKEADADRLFAQLENQAAHLEELQLHKPEIGKELAACKSMLQEIRPQVRSTEAYGSVPSVFSAACSEGGYPGPERLTKPTMQKCLRLAETRAEEHDALMRRRAECEAERLQNMKSGSAAVPPIVEADALQKLIEQVRDDLPAQSARLKLLKADQEQLVQRKIRAEVDAGPRDRRFKEAESSTHEIGEESVADALGKLTKQQPGLLLSHGWAQKIDTLWPMEDLGQKGEEYKQRMRERQASQTLASAAQQQLQGVWRPQGTPSAVRVNAEYDPRNPELDDQVIDRASSTDVDSRPASKLDPHDQSRPAPKLSKKSQNSFKPVGVPSTLAYRPDDGLHVYWDFIVGLITKADAVRLVYSFWHGRKSVCDVLATEYADIDGSGNAIFAGHRHIVGVPGDPGTRLVMELQGMVDGVPNVPLGWAMVGAFRNKVESVEKGWLNSDGQQLNDGRFQCPIMMPPARLDMDPLAYKYVSRLGQRTALCVRLGLPGQHSRDAQFVVHPMYEGKYDLHDFRT